MDKTLKSLGLVRLSKYEKLRKQMDDLTIFVWNHMAACDSTGDAGFGRNEHEVTKIWEKFRELASHELEE